MKTDRLQSIDFICGEDSNNSWFLLSFQALFSEIPMNWFAFVVLMGKKS